MQAAVEAPFIRLLSMSSSTDEEQLRVVPDRAEDLHSVSTPLCKEVGDLLCDRLVGFTGDLPGGWREAYRKALHIAVAVAVACLSLNFHRTQHQCGR